MSNIICPIPRGLITGSAVLPRRLAGSWPDFDGTADHLQISSAIASAGRQGTMVVFLIPDGAAGNQRLFRLQDGTATGPSFSLNASEAPILFAQDAGTTTRINVTSATSVPVDGLWHCLMVSFDLTLGLAAGLRMYLDDVDVAPGSGTFSNTDIYWQAANTTIGATFTGTSRYPGCMAHMWTDDSFVDFGVEGIRRQWLTAQGRPANVGANGELPLSGTQPLVYLGNEFSTFQNNLGSAGNFAVTGALTACAVDPDIQIVMP